MPYKSAAQRAKFHILEKQGKISHATVEEFDQASKGMALPEHVGEPTNPLRGKRRPRRNKESK